MFLNINFLLLTHLLSQKGDGLAGEATRERGFLSYGFEICKYLKKDNWTRKWSKEHQVPFAYKSNQWVGYDDEASIKIKVFDLKKIKLK